MDLGQRRKRVGQDEGVLRPKSRPHKWDRSHYLQGQGQKLVPRPMPRQRPDVLSPAFFLPWKFTRKCWLFLALLWLNLYCITTTYTVSQKKNNRIG